VQQSSRNVHVIFLTDQIKGWFTQFVRPSVLENIYSETELGHPCSMVS